MRKIYNHIIVILLLDIDNEGIAFHIHLTDGNTKDISFSNEDTETVDENTKVVIQYKEEISE